MNQWLLETLVRHAPMGIAFVDLECRFVLVNDKLAAINGRSPADHIGRTVQEVVPDLWPVLGPVFRRVMDTGEAVTDVEVKGHVASAADVVRHWLEGFYPVRATDGAIVGVGVMVVELTEQRRAEAEHRAIVAAMPDFIFALSRDGTHLSFHAPSERQLFVPPEQIIGRRVRDLLPAAVADTYDFFIALTLATGQMQVFEYALDYPDGEHFFDARMVHKDADDVLVIVRDISDRVRAERERRLLEEQFRQAQKMEAIGQLAGGVAHDFNNLLTIINGYGDMLVERLPRGDPAHDVAVQILKAGERAAGLTRQLLMFSRQQILEPQVLDLNTVVGHTKTMLHRLIGEDLHLTMTLAAGELCIRADPGQIEQALLNLCVNARDAMPTGGRLAIETARVTIDGATAQAMTDVAPGEYAALSVSDTGSGMNDATKARIFEPFFTTKGPGKGTGLGLAVVFGVVRQSGGHIDVKSAAGAGATFTLYFPLVEEAVTRPAPASRSAMPRGNETVLVVEDDAAVRSMTRHILQRCGYTVLDAADGQDAIQLLDRHDGQIDLLVSDVVMPNLGGRQLAETVLKHRPAIKVLFLSGHTDDAVVRHGIQGAEFAFLQKPFTPAALATKVRDTIDQP